jgi:pimeloyl-ACP methyl ester carboxylesterase
MWAKMLLLVALALGGITGAPARGAAAPPPPETLSCFDSGSGPGVVLIPSLSGCAFGFRHVVSALHAAGYRTLIVEPLGVGFSPRPERADYSLVAQADRVATELERRGVRDALVVGHGIGGAVALRLAYRHPGLVRGVVSIEGGPAESAATPGFRRAMKVARWMRLIAGSGWIKGKFAKHLRSVSADPAWVTEAVVDSYFAGVERDPGAALRAFSAMGRAPEPESLGVRLPEIRCPVVLLLGGFRHKGGPPAEDVARLAERLPRFAQCVVPGAGAFVQEERPGAIVSAVREMTALVADTSRCAIAP